MRRVGNRLQLALKRWMRTNRRLELLRFRRRWAQKFGEYECVGGPLDCEIRKCKLPYSVVLAAGGYYSLDRADYRLHFHARAAVSSNWSDGL